MAGKTEPSFEEALTALEKIVDAMENGELTLAELMENYSQGVTLSQKCLKALDRAEKTMDIMIKDEHDEVQELELKIEGD